MKNGLLVWNVLLTLIAGYLLINHFSGRKKSATPSAINIGDSVQQNKHFKIAYFEMDSIEANFAVVKSVMAELSSREQEINNEMDKLGKEIQQKYTYYQNLAAGGNMSQEQNDAASKEIKALDDKMRSRKQQLEQTFFEFKNKKQTDIKTKIESFLKEFNKDQQYAYIISYEQGLFYYRDTTYNITPEVVTGLNEMYKQQK